MTTVNILKFVKLTLNIFVDQLSILHIVIHNYVFTVTIHVCGIQNMPINAATE